ncbi:MAG: hypothetical protein ACI36X_05160 [Bacteroidaceae bacterium]
MPKYILQEMPDLNRQDEQRVVPRLVGTQLLSGDELVEKVISYNRGFSRSVVDGVLTALVDTVRLVLADGNTVKIDGIGTLSVSLAFDDDKPTCLDGEDDRMAYRKVRVKSLNFRTDAETTEWVAQHIDLERAMGGVKRIKADRYTLQERQQRALAYIDEHGSIGLGQYAELNSVSRPTASRELNRWSAGNDAPLRAEGKAPHRVWVRRNASDETES